MKRSEMLYAIDDFLIEKKFHKSGSFDMANQILDLIEKFGMLPPLNEQVYHHMDNDDRISVNKVKPFYTWEREDEK